MIKKIIIISSYFAPAWAYGGPPKVLFTLAKELAKQDIDINIITTDSLGETRSDKLYEEIDKVKIYRFKNFSNTASYKTNLFYSPGLILHAKKILSGTDIVLFSDVRNIFNWQLYGYMKEQKIPYGIFAFGEIPYGKSLKALVKKIFDLIWVQDFIRNAKWLFAQTEHEKKMYQSYFGERIADVDLLPLPAEEIKTKQSLEELTQFRKKFNIVSDEKIILYVGRINYLKGIDILIKSIEKLLKNDKRLKLMIVGRDDGYLSKLRSLIPAEIKRQIFFTGPLYDKDVSLAYAISSCFAITPRFYEETSTASLEALSFGIPAVVTREAYIPYLSTCKAGVVVNNNSFEISEAIKKIIYVSEQEKNKIKLEAKNFIKKHFNAKIVAQKLLTILSSV